VPNFATATIIGHLGRDPETRTAQSGTVVFNAALAVNTGYGNNKRTTWWSIAAFGKTAERLESFNLKKGVAIGFQGEPSIREWEDRDGNKRQTLELSASTFILVGEKPEGEEVARSAPAAAKKVVTEDRPFDDEIPF